MQKPERIQDVISAREAIKAIVGETELKPENDELRIEIKQDRLAALSQITVVAGAGFEPTTFGL